MNIWFMTQNRQILDLKKCVYFWCEHLHTETYKIFTKTDDDIEWCIAEVSDENKALEYLNKIHELLLK